jgi:H+/Cl- antiporter ClcA
VTAVITLGWVLALVALLAVRSSLSADVRWWLWTCVCGIVMGLFGLWYVPFLKRRRARLAAGRAAAAESQAAGTQLSSGYESRDNGSNTVSSTETPGKSTRS